MSHRILVLVPQENWKIGRSNLQLLQPENFRARPRKLRDVCRHGVVRAKIEREQIVPLKVIKRFDAISVTRAENDISSLVVKRKCPHSIEAFNAARAPLV